MNQWVSPPYTQPLKTHTAPRQIQRKPVPEGIYEDLSKWPHAEQSQRYPLTIRFMLAGDRQMALTVLKHLEKAWQVEIDQLGFRPPLAYDKTGQKRLQAFLLRGADTAVDGIQRPTDSSIWWDAFESYISVDAWGKYAGPILDSTIAHEFNHTLHAAYDWYESPGFFETSATYIQDKVYPEDNNYLSDIADFQQHPEWPIDRDDQYKTWFMYGASLYLFFLEQQYFSQTPTFLAQMWEGARNKPRPLDPKTGIPLPETNEPDWIDSLEALLPKGVSYADTVVQFARWRYYTGRQADGRHFHDGDKIKPAGEVKIATTLKSSPASYRSKGPMLLGSEYINLKRSPKGHLNLQVQGTPGSRWAIQVVPGIRPGSDGDVVGPSGLVEFGSLAQRTLIVTALPPVGSSYDPDTRTDQLQPFELKVSEP